MLSEAGPRVVRGSSSCCPRQILVLSEAGPRVVREAVFDILNNETGLRGWRKVARDIDAWK